MKTTGTDAVEALGQWATGTAPIVAAERREEGLRAARSAVVAELRTTVARRETAARAAAGERLPVDREVAALIAQLQQKTMARQGLIARHEADDRQLEAEQARLERVLRVPAALPAEVVDLGAEFTPLTDLTWKGPAPTTWCSEARAGWWRAVEEAGAAVAGLELAVPTSEEVSAARALVAAAHPATFAAAHRELCQPFEAPARGF